MAKNEAKIKFTADCQEFNAQIQRADSTMKELRAELKLNETQMKATGATVEGLRNKHGILSNQLAAQESKVAALANKLEAAKQNFGENSTEVAKWRTQLLNAQTAQARLEQAVNQCANELQQLESAAQQSRGGIDSLTAKINEQESELAQLKRKYADLVAEQKDGTDEARALASQIDRLSSDLKENRAALNNATDAADRLDNSLDEVADSARDAGDGFTVMKGAAADLVADGIEKVVSVLGEVGAESFVMANDIDSATNTFIAKTGESVDSAGEFEEVMTSIYNGNYGESFDDIAESMATVKTSLGDIGTAELEAVTTKALVMRDTFDMDVNESVRAVNSMMNQFGITADEAYNLIAQGAQNGLNQNGDLLDTVNEYSVQFKNAGYSAEDMFNMLANGVDAGTWSVDKLGDAVKEFNIRASDGTVGDAIKENAKAFGMTKAEAEALATEVGQGSVGAYQKLADQLRAVDDDTQRYQLGVAMFGTMWEDLGEDAVFALLDTQGEISTTTDALDKINSVKYDDLGSAFEGIKRNLQTSVAEPIKNEVMPAVNEFVEDVDWQGVGQTIGEVMGVGVEAVLTFANGIKAAVGWMAEHKALCAGVAAAIGIVATAIGAYNVVQAVKAAMDAAQVTTVWALVAAYWAQATAAMAAIAPYVLVVAAIAAVIAIIVVCVKHWDKIVEACKNAWESVKSTLSTWGEWINANVIQPVVGFFKSLWSDIKSIWSGICDSVQSAWDFICNLVSVGVQLIGSILSAAFQIITLPFRFIWENCKQYVFSAWEWMKSKVSAAASAISSKISSIFSKVQSFFSKIWTSCKSIVSETWSSIRNAVSQAAQKVFSTVSNIWNKVKSETSKAFNACKSVATSVWNSLKSAVTNAVNACKSKVSSVWNSIKSTTSSVFQSCVSVVTDKFGKIKSKITDTINGAKNAVKSAIDKIKGFFNFKWELPKLKLPHFTISGKFSLNPPQVPKFSVEWYKTGAIFTKPTIFNTPYGFKGVGEAGAEAVLPIAKLEHYVSNAVEKAQNVVGLDHLAQAIEDLANRPNTFKIGDREVALATASASDSVSGLRTSFKNRGLALE